MKINRRKFMVSTGAAAGMGMVATTGMAGSNKGIRLTPAQIKARQEIADVADFVNEYSDRFEVHAQSEKSFTVRSKTSVKKLVKRLQAKNLPFDAVICNGNQMDFVHGKSHFVLEHQV